MDQRIQRRSPEDRLASAIPLPRPGPKFFSAVVWWAFGLYALFLA